jgi:hypothetical protein
MSDIFERALRRFILHPETTYKMDDSNPMEWIKSMTSQVSDNCTRFWDIKDLEGTEFIYTIEEVYEKDERNSIHVRVVAHCPRCKVIFENI